VADSKYKKRLKANGSSEIWIGAEETPATAKVSISFTGETLILSLSDALQLSGMLYDAVYSVTSCIPPRQCACDDVGMFGHLEGCPRARKGSRRV